MPDSRDALIIIETSCLQPRHYQESFERDSLEMTFYSRHGPANVRLSN